jgi:6,7-dimethyl-8-ribityllumazine synthase
MLKIAIITSRFNPEVTEGLLQGALQFLKENHIESGESDIFYSPGAFEIPLLAQKLAQTGRYSGIICLGCVIKGDTAHFEFISLGATIGIMQSMLKTEIPITFGILTTYTDEQALARSRSNSENKGREAASACLENIRTLAKISEVAR